MLKTLFLLSVLWLAACELDMDAEEQHFTAEQLVETMRVQGMRHVRVEKNPHLTQRLSTPIYDIYLGTEQFIVVQGSEERSGTDYMGYFRAYEARGWEFETRQNMLVIGRPAASDGVVKALHGM